MGINTTFSHTYSKGVLLYHFGYQVSTPRGISVLCAVELESVAELEVVQLQLPVLLHWC